MAQLSYETAIAILNSINGLSVVDTEGKYLFLAKPLAAQFGTTQEEAIGRPATDFVASPVLCRILETKRPEWGKFHQTVTLRPPGCPPSIINRLLVHPDGDRTQEPIGAMAYTALAYTPTSITEPAEIFLQEFKMLQRQVEMLRSHLGEVYHTTFEDANILGHSPKLQAVKDLVARVAPTSATVCILGETGTGKELAANAIHRLSNRKDKPFVKINCAAIPRNLIESELFGYEAGAFTGASRQGKIGKFEVANGGTLLLDEIGELPLELQAKLLRVIQQGELERVGGTTSIPIDVRFICSTNRNLQKMVQEGTFRADLYYRINVIELNLPPLRERPEDIPIMLDQFIRDSNIRHGLSVSGAVQQVYQLLLQYDWPGNVRELENCVERACILCGSGPLMPAHFNSLPVDTSLLAEMESQAQEPDASPLESMEREMILQALKSCKGNKKAAADMLHIARSTMYEKIKKYKIEL